MRAGKSPLEVVSPEDTLSSNLIGANTGNLLFSSSAHKMLSVPGVDITAGGLVPFKPERAHEISESYDVVVLPFANAFRPTFARALDIYADLIEQLTIPVVIFGIGAQAPVSRDMSVLEKIKEPALRFLKAVSERTGVIGVRGEFTHDYIVSLGFRNVEVIGCPSMFTFGERLHVEKRAGSLSRDSKVAMNGTKVGAMTTLVGRHMRAYPNLRFVGQSREELRMMLFGEPANADLEHSEFPAHVSHPLYRSNQLRCFVDPRTWIDYLRAFEFSFGARIHGNIAALLAGTPGFVLANDSRTLELSRYFSIPHREPRAIGPDTDAAELYEEADYTDLNRGHGERFQRMRAFLARHGLETIFDHAGAEDAYEEKLASVAFPPPVEVRHADPPPITSSPVPRWKGWTSRIRGLGTPPR